MNLIRTGSPENQCQAQHTSIGIHDEDIQKTYDPARWNVYCDFHSFGNGKDNTSNFEARVCWSDVVALVREFEKMGHPEAVELTRQREILQQVAALVTSFRSPKKGGH